MRITKKGANAHITITPSDAAYLATILSYARNADVCVDGTPGSQRRGRRMLFSLAGVCEAIDADAETYLFRLSEPEQISDSERKAYTDARRVFDPEYGTEEAV